MKKMLLTLLRWPCLLQDVLNRRLLFQQTGGSSTKETITHHFFVSGIGRRKLSMQPKFVAAQKMLLKQETQQTFVNGLLGLYFRHLYSAGSALCIAHNNCMVPIDMGNSIYTIINMPWVPSSCFCIVISLSLRVK